ncbi:MAG TPA: hypothetical protein VFU86_02080 [Terriglobales bacterium]|nr:hypothetical protein [Terriglobales bacterium]
MTDFVAALESLGYTEREAAFLYLVAAHSGYFLRRQFNYFIDRHKGFLAHRFLEKAHAAGHVETLEYGQGFHVYHLFSKPLYRMLGEPDSQNRRKKGDGSVRARLMVLDYVLENDGEHYLVSGEERLRFFTDVRGVRSRSLEDSFLFSGNFPISIADRNHPETSLVRFTFIDEGLLSTRRFSRFLTSLSPLLRELGTFELVYVACSTYNFPSATHEFKRRFQTLVSSQQRALLPGLERPSEHPRAVRNAQFITVLFHYSYPPIQRSEPRGSVHGSGAGSELSCAIGEVR